MTDRVTLRARADWELIIPAAATNFVVSSPLLPIVEFNRMPTDTDKPAADAFGHRFDQYHGITRFHFVTGAIFARVIGANDTDLAVDIDY